jgi:hypothetical protein
MRAAIATAVAATLSFLSCANAQTPRPEQHNPRTAQEVERVFDSIDRDSDDRISRAESRGAKRVQERFDGVDADEDGFLSRSEYRSRPRDEPFE